MRREKCLRPAPSSLPIGDEEHRNDEHPGHQARVSGGEETRVLHRITPRAEWPAISDGDPLMEIAVINLETAGLDPQHDAPPV